jgi:hypothetical protein
MKHALIIGLSITLLSCSKTPVDDPSKQNALTTGTWKLTGYMTDYSKDGVYEEDTYTRLGDCVKDNNYTFQSDGNEITDEGPTKCISSNPQTSTSPWSFKDNQARLQFGGATYQIEELTDAILRLKGTVSYNIIFTINVKLAYSKQ